MFGVPIADTLKPRMPVVRRGPADPIPAPLFSRARMMAMKAAAEPVLTRENSVLDLHAAFPEVGTKSSKPFSKTAHSLTKPRSSGSSEEKSFEMVSMATPPTPPPRLSDSYKELQPIPESESEGYTSPLVTKHTPHVCPDAPQANRQRVSAPMTPVRMNLASKKCPDAPKKLIWTDKSGKFWLEAEVPL